MTADNSRAFLASTALHALVVALVLYFSYAASQQIKPPPRILELVAGEGDNFRATEAAALGVPGGISLTLPKLPAAPAEPPKAEPLPAEPKRVETPRPEPPKAEVTKAEPVKAPTTKAEIRPITKAPATKKAEPKQRTMAQNIRRQLIVGELKGRKQAAKERDAEQKRLTKEEFDKAQRTKVASAKSAATKFEKIDSEGIAKGVVGGSKSNKIGGAGGTALSVAERSEADAYAAFLNQKLTDALEEITGLEDGLRAEAEFEVQSSGRLARGKIIKSSRNERFDLAVLHAIASIRMPEGPPKGFERTQQVTFTSKPKS